MSDTRHAGDGTPSPTATEALHTTVAMPFEDAVPFVQLEHELADFETVTVTRLDRMIEVTLGRSVGRTALLVICHPEIAYRTITMCPTLGGMLPCTTVLYETPEDDGLVHVHHISITKAIRDLGLEPDECDADLQAIIDLTGELMDTVWNNIEQHAPDRPEQIA